MADLKVLDHEKSGGNIAGEIKDDLLDDATLMAEDPELLAMKKEYEENKEKSHKRETTVDLTTRLEKEIQNLEKEEEKKVFIENINDEIVGETTEASTGEQPVVNVDTIEPAMGGEGENISPEVDQLWNMYVENARLEKEKEEAGLGKIMENPFLQKIMNPAKAPVSDLAAGYMGLEEKFLLYPILLGNYRIHLNAVSDYTLRKLLATYEPKCTNLYHFFSPRVCVCMQ